MNSETLHAIDALYLENFLEVLLFNIVDVQSKLRESLEQAESLSVTEYLSFDCRSRYKKIAKRLEPLLSELSELSNDLYDRGELRSEYEPVVQWGLVESIPECDTRAVIDKFNFAEQKLIGILNHIGSGIESIPDQSFLWNCHAEIRSYLKLTPIAERPCYNAESMCRFCANPPYLLAYCFAKPQVDVGDYGSASPWLLSLDFMSLTNLPLLEAVEVELEIRGGFVTSFNDLIMD